MKIVSKYDKRELDRSSNYAYKRVKLYFESERAKAALISNDSFNTYLDLQYYRALVEVIREELSSISTDASEVALIEEVVRRLDSLDRVIDTIDTDEYESTIIEDDDSFEEVKTTVDEIIGEEEVKKAIEEVEKAAEEINFFVPEEPINFFVPDKEEIKEEVKQTVEDAKKGPIDISSLTDKLSTGKETTKTSIKDDLIATAVTGTAAAAGGALLGPAGIIGGAAVTIATGLAGEAIDHLKEQEKEHTIEIVTKAAEAAQEVINNGGTVTEAQWTAAEIIGSNPTDRWDVETNYPGGFEGLISDIGDTFNNHTEDIIDDDDDNDSGDGYEYDDDNTDDIVDDNTIEDNTDDIVDDNTIDDNTDDITEPPNDIDDNTEDNDDNTSSSGTTGDDTSGGSTSGGSTSGNNTAGDDTSNGDIEYYNEHDTEEPPTDIDG